MFYILSGCISSISNFAENFSHIFTHNIYNLIVRLFYYTIVIEIIKLHIYLIQTILINNRMKRKCIENHDRVSFVNWKPLLTGLLFLLVNLCCLPLFAQNKTISGVVVDETGEPVLGANVSVAGTTMGIITDMDGKFSLDAPASGTLVISYIGYKKKEVPLGLRRMSPES